MRAKQLKKACTVKVCAVSNAAVSPSIVNLLMTQRFATKIADPFTFLAVCAILFIF